MKIPVVIAKPDIIRRYSGRRKRGDAQGLTGSMGLVANLSAAL
jgi:hypothetical protein